MLPNNEEIIECFAMPSWFQYDQVNQTNEILAFMETDFRVHDLGTEDELMLQDEIKNCLTVNEMGFFNQYRTNITCMAFMKFRLYEKASQEVPRLVADFDTRVIYAVQKPPREPERKIPIKQI